MVSYQVIPPPNHLKKWVRLFWTLDCTGDAPGQSILKIFACRYPRLVFQHGNGRSAISIGNSTLPVSFFSGLHSRPNTLSFSGQYTLTGISFYPHAVKTIFGIDCFELIDQFPDIQGVAPGWLEEKLVNTVDQLERIKMIGDFVYALILRNGEQDLLATDSLSFLANANNENAIRLLTSHYNISERQLERRFKRNIGFTPKEYLQITRFEKAVDLINNGRFDKLSDIAYELNFYDQTHFIKDFKSFSGYTPLAFYKQQKNFEETSSMFIE